jgi:hypothetical protein
MAEDVLGIDHGEEFVSQNGGDDTGTESKHGDESIDLPMDQDAYLTIQVEQKNGNETVESSYRVFFLSLSLIIWIHNLFWAHIPS